MHPGSPPPASAHPTSLTLHRNLESSGLLVSATGTCKTILPVLHYAQLARKLTGTGSQRRAQTASPACCTEQHASRQSSVLLFARERGEDRAFYFPDRQPASRMSQNCSWRSSGASTSHCREISTRRLLRQWPEQYQQKVLALSGRYKCEYVLNPGLFMTM